MQIPQLLNDHVLDDQTPELNRQSANALDG
jgi:hypothetical protein